MKEIIANIMFGLMLCGLVFMASVSDGVEQTIIETRGE